MAHARFLFAAVFFGLLVFAGLSGCGGGDEDDSGFPDVRGTYRGRATETDSGCFNPANNRTGIFNVVVNISSQNEADFSGILQDEGGNNSDLAGQLTASGGVIGVFIVATDVFASQATFRGTLTRDSLVVNYAGQVSVGEQCVFGGAIIATRQ